MWLDPNPTGYPNEAVTKIFCPLLMMRGDSDHLISRETVFELSEGLKNSKLLNIPFAGHAAFEDQREIIMISLNEFFKSRPRLRPGPRGIGDNPPSEARVSAVIVEQNGVSARDVLCEETSTSTWENAGNAAQICRAHGLQAFASPSPNRSPRLVKNLTCERQVFRKLV
ncbi:MAG: YdcF family protein [Chthoniobacterales bacterium]|nr:YdcF family protein [Chthoniobacterales bacterium]